ncbi:hypothetical protein MMC07_004747 [Pseudocyphellaria aurata]|nr:hypothetical protein [Pseudocyphellaria aurata]
MVLTWLAREGFTADVVLKYIDKLALNPALTLPLLLLSYFTSHEVVVQWLKLLFFCGLARWLNGVLNAGVLDNWKSSHYEWAKEIAVITGGSDGIGKHIALRLAENNVTVAILDIQPLTFKASANVHFYDCDITSTTAVSTTAAAIRASFGAPTLLFNNGGVASVLPILSTTEASVARTFNVNILSHFRLVKEFLPAMISAEHGTVISIASLAAAASTPHIVDYSCTKAAVLAFHEGLAAELKTTYAAPKVRTVCVLPGWTTTKMTTGVKNEDKFWMPTWGADAMAGAIVEKVLSGTSGLLIVPRMGNFTVWTLRCWPMWLQTLARQNAIQFVSEMGKETEA